MGDPLYRPRRLRDNVILRQMLAEVDLRADQLIMPLFVRPGRGQRRPIGSMPGQFQLSVDMLVEEARRIADTGVRGLILFGIPESKDAEGSSGIDPSGIVPQAVAALKQAVPQMLVMTDVCLCEYTDHGHCGVLAEREGRQVVDNDHTVDVLARMAQVHAQAGADVVAPSDMMDGRVRAIRLALDADGYGHVPIMAYSVKYASNFYGPFREAAESPPQFGDRRGYQMDWRRRREAETEAALDVIEGADIIMVKPAMAYLDVLSGLRQRIALPLAAYHVSGEYAMIKAAAERGWIDERGTALESLTAIRRAGADLILTYFAPQAAEWLREERSG